MMPTLRITQSTESEGKHHVEIALEGDGLPRQTATASFTFDMTAQDQEDLRWYLEDYLQFPHDPAPTIAARIERRMTQIGAELFKLIFQASNDTRSLWAKTVNQLDTVRVEVATDVSGASDVPWELLFDPDTNGFLALQSHTFVRTYTTAVREPKAPQAAESIRILLVICRPARDELPFRSDAMCILKGLSKDAAKVFQLDVLRPPTFDQLGRVLRTAKGDGRPYHVVHFDGHGDFMDFEVPGASAGHLQAMSPLLLSEPRPGAHGYLLFENPAVDADIQLVDGPALGRLLLETDVPVLVLNACRSAYAEAATEPGALGPRSDRDAKPADPHVQARAFGSLTQEVMDAGVAGVVAMRYNVYVVTGAQFLVDLYAALARATTLGEAVTLGRKQLHDQPLRGIAFDPRPLRDWMVPVVYESRSVALFPEPVKDAPLKITLRGDGAGVSQEIDSRLPKPPDAGFFGRDETLLALDRAFDTQSIVLLHAYAGSGKTATAAEFARWYALTGGVQGPVLFTSFEQYLPLARALDRIGEVFETMLEKTGVNWLALDDAERRQVALQVLNQIPVLWIWDNVEPVAGFPSGTESTWSEPEQRELVDFLRDARETKAKFLLTSRREERAWLGDELPRRIAVPPMPMQERVQLARALAEKHGRKLTDVDDWRPLLGFTGGNPLTITVLVGQALRGGLKTRDDIEAFVDKLRRGEAAFNDEADQGRSRSLGASLDYGFKSAFTDTERKQLACLHLFQGFVDVDALRMMGGDPTMLKGKPPDWCLPELRGLTREAGTALLDRAAEIGLLTARGGGYYTIHPALPWFFKTLFDEHYPAPPDPQSPIANRQSEIARAFVEAMGQLGDFYHNQYGSGNRDVIAALDAEEANLLHARHLSRTHCWWDTVMSTMQGVRALYEHTGRRSEWRRLVEEIVPDFVDPANDGPLPGREEEWSLVTDYRVGLADEARQWADAERLQRINVDWTRRRAAAALELKPEALDDAQRNAIRWLAVSLARLGHIQRELHQPECVAAYEEALPLYERIGDRATSAITCFNLGHAHKNIPAIRDLTKAERWYRRSLELVDERDRQGRGRCLGELGSVAFARFQEARAAGNPKQEVLRHINAALQGYQQALKLLPADAAKDLAVVHNQLGAVYAEVGDIDRALSHWRESIRLEETQDNLYGAARTRYNVALALRVSGRLADARDYARAALRNFETYGAGATQEIQKTQQLIARIEQCAVERRGSSVGEIPTRQLVAPAGSNRGGHGGNEVAEALRCRGSPWAIRRACRP